MYWIALCPSHNEDATAWGWRALRFTPRVACVDEAIVLEAGASERLFGGRSRLLRALFKGVPTLECEGWAGADTSLQALSLLRLKRRGEEVPAELPGGLPLDTFTAAVPHLHTLERIGETVGSRVSGRADRITDGAVSSDGEWVALRTRTHVTFHRLADLTAGRWRETRRVDLTPFGEAQGEAVAFGSGDTLYLAGEGGGKARPGTFVRLTCHDVRDGS